MKNKKNLIISVVGDNSYHNIWINNNPNFDLFLIYYKNNEDIIDLYKKQCLYFEYGEFYQNCPSKFIKLKKVIEENIKIIKQYKYIWVPDDDIYISSNDINELFHTAEYYDLFLCQPSLLGYYSHDVTRPKYDNILRYTNFVEVMAPLFNIDTLLLVKESFDINFSSWGYDFLWPRMLGYPKDKIAIIDKINMFHTKPVGQEYSRFPNLPHLEMNELLEYYDIDNKIITYSQINNK